MPLCCAGAIAVVAIAGCGDKTEAPDAPPPVSDVKPPEPPVKDEAASIASDNKASSKDSTDSKPSDAKDDMKDKTTDAKPEISVVPKPEVIKGDTAKPTPAADAAKVTPTPESKVKSKIDDPKATTGLSLIHI